MRDKSRVSLRTLIREGMAHPRLRRLMRSPLFEPLVAILIILVLVGALYAYTGNWPPLVVVESNSMQHGSSDVLGVINTGDIVLVKQESSVPDLATYVDGETSGYSTYGEYGNVILYHANGDFGSNVVPVIHRALVWLNYAGSGGYEIPSVFQLKCSSFTAEQYQLVSDNGTPGCLPSPTTPVLGKLVLYDVGWQGIMVSIDLTNLYTLNEKYSGFVTMGDNNICGPGYSPCPNSANVVTGEYDQWVGISTLVQPGWVEGVARGMIPWFGALKLWLGQEDAGQVPTQTWDYLAASIVAIILLPQVLPWGLRRLRDRRRDRRRPKGPEEEAGKDDQPDSRRSRRDLP